MGGRAVIDNEAGPAASRQIGRPALDRGAGRLATLVAASAAALLAALWMREPRVSYLAGALVATGVAVVVAWRIRVARVVALLFAAAAVAFGTPAWWTQRLLGDVDGAWLRTRELRERDGEAAYVRAVAQAAEQLASIARAGLAVPDSSPASFDRLGKLIGHGRGERGLVLLHGGRPTAWAGEVRVPLDSMRGPSGVLETPFYVVLYVSAERGAARVIATELLQANPPGTLFARSLGQTLTDETGGWRSHFAAPRAGLDSSWHVLTWMGGPLVALQRDPPGRESLRARVVERGRSQAAPGLAAMVLVLVAGAWRRPRGESRHLLSRRLGSLLVPLAAIQVVPLSSLSNATRLFDPSVFFVPNGLGYTASLGALALTSVVLLLAIFAILRSGRPLASRFVSAIVVLGVTGVAPFVLRDLARGISPPTLGATLQLWVGWQLALFLPAAALMIAGATAGRVVLGRGRGVPPLVAPLLGGIAAVVGPVLWRAPAGWPSWYPLLWCAAVGALALTRRTRAVVVAASAVAGLGAATLVWGAVAHRRVELAQQDVRGLTTPDSTAESLLERMNRQLADAPPRTEAELLERYASSALWAADLPVVLTSWVPVGYSDSVAATVATEALSVDSVTVRQLVSTVRETGDAAVARLNGEPGVAAVLAVPHEGRVTTVAVFSRTRVVPEKPLAPLLGLRPPTRGEVPYTVSLLERLPRDARAVDAPAPTWTREGSEIHGDWIVNIGTGRARAHVEVELRPFDVLVQRGALLVLLDMFVIGVLWTVPAAADGMLLRRVRVLRAASRRSYRARLTVALFGFFVVPAATFAVWSYRQLQSSDVEGRRLLVRETLRAAAAEVPDSGGGGLAALGGRLQTPLLVYEGGVLKRASDPLLVDLAPTGLMLPRDQALHVALGEEQESSQELRAGRTDALFGYRAAVDAASQRVVVAAPARTDDVVLDQRRRDLGFLVLLVAAGGALAALWLSGLAARELARPVGALREAALAIAAGEREPALTVEPPTEFRPVFAAFRRMATDLSESRSALEAAQRRTAAVLRNVASGVVAVGSDGRLTIANPRAEQLLGTALPDGAPLADVAPGELAQRVREFLDRREPGPGDEEFDLELHGRQLRARLTRLDVPRVAHDRAAVLTLDDLTELARARSACSRGARWRGRSRTRSRTRSRRSASACSTCGARTSTGAATSTRSSSATWNACSSRSTGSTRSRARSAATAPRPTSGCPRMPPTSPPWRATSSRSSASARVRSRGRSRVRTRRCTRSRATRSCARCCSTCSRTRAMRGRAPCASPSIATGARSCSASPTTARGSPTSCRRACSSRTSPRARAAAGSGSRSAGA
ncbi:histidine kinase HAMP region domain protein [Gemmatirosa kalamazoonensis]|uniref:Histidine kinase HAMP region domain protein n=1 Tax=Gemmatirosa kalamazoonensis TaxID=861299 RepID=W0RH46_9BACT|nr:histidine kinase HAMP region domain protein [Gemmatirosa kalamazoonensis]